jgi:hypothetical protein
MAGILGLDQDFRQDVHMKLFGNKDRPPAGPRQAASPDNKVIITGPGRSGTTFLMQLLTDLGFDTGFDQESMQVSDLSHAGLEQGLFTRPHRKAPLTPNYIIKSPLISDNLQLGCEREDLVVDHVYIPIRPIEDVARSRARVSDLAPDHPGGLDQGLDLEGQMNRTARSLYTLLDTITRYDLPHTFIAFPRLTQEPQYLYQRLQFLCSGIDYVSFRRAFESRVKPELVHNFGDSQSP